MVAWSTMALCKHGGDLFRSVLVAKVEISTSCRRRLSLHSDSAPPPHGYVPKGRRILAKVTPWASFLPLGCLGAGEMWYLDAPSPMNISLNSELGPSASQAVLPSHTTQFPSDFVRAWCPLVANTFCRPQKLLPPGSRPPLAHFGSLVHPWTCYQSVINVTCTHAQPNGKHRPCLIHLPS